MHGEGLDVWNGLVVNTGSCRVSVESNVSAWELGSDIGWIFRVLDNDFIFEVGSPVTNRRNLDIRVCDDGARVVCAVCADVVAAIVGKITVSKSTCCDFKLVFYNTELCINAVPFENVGI